MTDSVVQKIQDEMQRLGLTRRELARRLNDVSDKRLTEQALGLWFARDRVPDNRLADLDRVFHDLATNDSGKVSALELVARPVMSRLVQPQAAGHSAQAQMLADWLDKIQDPMVKLECFHGCTALLMQALRQPEPTAAHTPPPQP